MDRAEGMNPPPHVGGYAPWSFHARQEISALAPIQL
jgi:hypothetical protein